MSTDFILDDIDRDIVAELRRNGRATNQQIADRLGLAAATVSTRIKRMEDADKLRVVAVSDFAAHGFGVLISIAIEVDGRPASEVGAELSALPEVFATHLVTGRYDVDILVTLHDIDELNPFLLEKVAKIRGIRSLTPTLTLDIVKFKFDVAPIEARGAQ